MRVIALDLASHCGYSHTNGRTGVWDFSLKADESGELRLLRLKMKLEEVRTEWGIDFLAFEAHRHFGKLVRGGAVQTEMQGVLKLFCAEHKIPSKGYGPQQIKKHATGKGRASKDEMIDSAEIKWKRIINDDNEADAMWLLDLALKDLKLEG